MGRPVARRAWSTSASLWLAGSAWALAACGARTGLDAPEPIDAGTPPIDASSGADVFRNDCPDPNATLVFVVTEQNEIFSFFPPAGAFKRVGTLSCPIVNPGASPFSMAVDRKGTAFVVFSDANLFRVNVNQGAACTGTPFIPGQHGFGLFGMGFATDQGGPAETLFVSEADDAGIRALGSIDTTSFQLSVVAPFADGVTRPELTGTGDGRLFLFSADDTGQGSFVAQVDKATAQVVAKNAFPNLPQGEAWAFAFWGGDFWLFTAPPPSPAQHATSSIVTRFRPSDGSVTQVTTLPSLIVGAGVSTCAPE